jgi:hypothetical protein
MYVLDYSVYLILREIAPVFRAQSPQQIQAWILHVPKIRSIDLSVPGENSKTLVKYGGV